MAHDEKTAQQEGRGERRERWGCNAGCNERGGVPDLELPVGAGMFM